MIIRAFAALQKCTDSFYGKCSCKYRGTIVSIKRFRLLVADVVISDFLLLVCQCCCSQSTLLTVAFTTQFTVGLQARQLPQW